MFIPYPLPLKNTKTPHQTQFTAVASTQRDNKETTKSNKVIREQKRSVEVGIVLNSNML
jgi:hypothetical protein